MNHVRWRKRPIGIAMKQFIILSCLSLVLFLTLTSVDAVETVRALKSQLISDSQLFITQTNQYLDSYVNNVENILLMVSTRPDLFSMKSNYAAQRVLQQYASLDGGVIQTIYLIGPHGKILTNAPVPYSILGNPFLPRLTKLATENFGGINWSEPYKSPVSGSTVAFVRATIDEGGHYVGTVVLEINLLQLTNGLVSVLGGTFEDFAVISTPGNVVTYNIADSLTPFETLTIPPTIEPNLIHTLASAPSGVTNLIYQHDALTIVKSDTNMLGWSIVDVIKQSLFYRSVYQVFRNFAAVATLWLVVLLIICFWFSRHVTLPIRKLSRLMDGIVDINHAPQIESRRTDEIGRLSRSYNRLMDRIRELVVGIKEMEQRKKEYELKMLQSQIGPHFLYNTLMCIGSLAKQQKLGEVNQTIKSLVGLISFSFDRVSTFVTLEEEIDALTHYLQIQSIRYGDCFSAEFQLDEASLNLQIPKLTLQPLVENAIFHGIVPKGHAGKIIVRSKVHAECLRIWVSDDGMGIEAERCRKILAQSAEGQSGPYGLNRIGIRNVHERLQMHFGEGFGLKIRSRIGRGTCVVIRMPRLESPSI